MITIFLAKVTYLPLINKYPYDSILRKTLQSRKEGNSWLSPCVLSRQFAVCPCRATSRKIRISQIMYLLEVLVKDFMERRLKSETKVRFLKYLRLIFNYDNFLPYPLENVELTAYIVADGLKIVHTAELRDLKFELYFWLLYQYTWYSG